MTLLCYAPTRELVMNRLCLAASLLLFAVPAAAQTERAPEGATGLTKKPPVYAKRFMAVTAHPDATRAAYDVLK